MAKESGEWAAFNSVGDYSQLADDDLRVYRRKTFVSCGHSAAGIVYFVVTRIALSCHDMPSKWRDRTLLFTTLFFFFFSRAVSPCKAPAVFDLGVVLLSCFTLSRSTVFADLYARKTGGFIRPIVQGFILFYFLIIFKNIYLFIYFEPYGSKNLWLFCLLRWGCAVCRTLKSTHHFSSSWLHLD